MAPLRALSDELFTTGAEREAKQWENIIRDQGDKGENWKEGSFEFLMGVIQQKWGALGSQTPQGNVHQRLFWLSVKSLLVFCVALPQQV